LTAVAPAEIRTVLGIAIGLLEQHGWCQRQSRSGSGALCAIAAVAAAANGDKVLEDAAQRGLESWVIWHTNFEGVTEWNDASERTKHEVLAALQAAAEEQAA
jgi:hypothetical protein